MSAETKIKTLGLVLPKPAQALGSYVPALRVGDTLYLSGVLSKTGEGEIFKGWGGQDSLERGVQAARLAMIQALGVVREALGSLDSVDRIIRLVGYVQSVPGFTDHSKALNGASDLLLEIFGDQGRHARSAVGVASLPMGAMVEVELTVRVSS